MSKTSCVCGYVHETDFDVKKRKYVTVQGTDSFHEIEGVNFRVGNSIRGYYEPDYYEIELLACPVCGTIRIKHCSLTERE